MTSDTQRGHAAPILEQADWLVAETGFSPDTQAVTETLLAQANGYIGIRGTPEDPIAAGIASIEGTYLNGVFLKEPIHYDETAYGFAEHNHKMVLAPDGKRILLHLAGTPLIQGEDSLEHQTRALDMRSGLLTRTSRWRVPHGGTVEVRTRRFVSLADKHLVFIDYEVTSIDFDGTLQLTTGLDTQYGSRKDASDPRAGALSVSDCLGDAQSAENTATSSLMLHPLADDEGLLVSASHLLLSEGMMSQSLAKEGFCGQEITCRLTPGANTRLQKTLYYGDGRPDEGEQLRTDALQALARSTNESFDTHLARQQAVLDAFWQTADIDVESDDSVCAAMRFNMFHLFQSAGKDGQRAMAAKGLTGPGYDGHYFWDTEIYAIPFFLFTDPAIARSLLAYRIGRLDAARARARTMGHQRGALYPWRTIGGDECSSFFPAGTAQYHINAAIAHALLLYGDVSGDLSLLQEGGAEMLFETARIWTGLGHFNKARGDAFCINEVTGPDEYTAMVDNNLYTNAMAQRHLRGAAEIANQLETSAPEFFADLSERLSLSKAERATWHKAADAMYLPYCKERGIHVQCDGFFDKPEWDFSTSQSPLLLHYHPLVIYRHQVLKQPDVVMAQTLLPDLFTSDQKARNLAYYEPRTTHDSTLSACIHAIANAESGSHARAQSFFEETVRMDLENRHGNSHYGVHIACMAGSWMALTYGFGGMRTTANGLAFRPYLPNSWRGYRFQVRHKGNRLELSARADGATYRLLDGATMTFSHAGNLVTIDQNTPVTLPFAS